MKEQNFKHVSILLEECLTGLALRPDGVYVDATLGGAGHSYHILEKLTTGHLICIDRDDMALENAKERLAPFAGKFTLVKSDFRDLNKGILSAGFDKVDGILFDLGVSSPQLDIPERGFSYMQDAPLDMRMDQTQALSAYDVVNTYEKEPLRKIIFQYGEERYGGLITAAILRKRAEKPIETTLELAEIIKYAMPPAARREKQHPAKRSFQAIRIAVNDELGAVEEAMQKSIDILATGGRLAVITFHSLEDRIVKSIMVENARDCICSKELPICVCHNKAKVKLVSRKPLLPSSAEIAENPRARSAKLRVCEKQE